MAMPAQIAVAQAQPAQPAQAPVSDPPLPAIQRAGVYLTWGVLGLITLFLLVMLVYLWTREPAVGALARGASATGTAPPDTVAFRLHATDQAAFREFWLKIVQMVLLNVLLPVLTALLGYIFGTQSRPASPS